MSCDATDDFIHLRQETPAHFVLERTIPFGEGTGIQARVGWARC